jgi:hypothetical protein
MLMLRSWTATSTLLLLSCLLHPHLLLASLLLEVLDEFGDGHTGLLRLHS